MASRAAGLYRLATRWAEPLAPLLLAARCARGKEDAGRIAERLGRGAGARPPGRLLWVHAASVGEALSALPLLERIAANGAPGAPAAMMTTGTAASAAIVAQRLPQTAFHRFAPLDGPRAARRFLDRWRPDAALWLESELWPNLLGQAFARGLPMALVNGRMSPRSFARWRLAPALARAMLGGFRVVLAQSEGDARRLAALGARQVQTIGDLKAAAAPQAADAGELARLKAAIGARPVWAAVSTHDGEERLAGRIHRRLAGVLPGLLTAIVPRHARRGDAVAARLAGDGLRVARRSQGALPTGASDVFLGDSMGEMGLYLALANPVFVGKSLLHRGGHNPREPALRARAVLFGPHMENFSAPARRLLQAGGAIQAADEQALAAAVRQLLADPDRARRMGQRAALAAAAEAEGVLDGALAALAPVLAGLGPPPGREDCGQHRPGVGGAARR